jgi:hypothetical protein
MTLNPRAKAQAFVEYALLVAVVVVAFIVGLSALSGAAVHYLAHTEATPPPGVLGVLPNHLVNMTLTCNPPTPSPLLTGTQFSCTVTVTDLTSPGPALLPSGSVIFASSSGSIAPCTLAGSGVTSSCTSVFTPTSTGQQNLTATYSPTSAHVQDFKQLPVGLITAVDQTQMTLNCLPAAVGEPGACTATVTSLFPGFGTTPSRMGMPIANLPVTISAGTGTFSDYGQLSPQTPNASSCTTTASGCTLLFRSNPVPAEQNQSRTLTATFAGDQDYQAATQAAVFQVGAAPAHSVKVTVGCSAGSQSSPLQVNQNDSTTCKATVIDQAPYPTEITPTGTVSWQPPASNNGGGGTFDRNVCTLARVDEQTAFCQVTYTPTSIGTPSSPYIDIQHINVRFNGDGFIHNQPATSSQAADVYVADQHPADVQVVCSDGMNPTSPLIVGGSSAATTACTAWVLDTVTNRPTFTPTGSLTWQGPPGAGAFTPTSSCPQLQPVDSKTAKCDATYQATVAGPNPVNPHQLSATYSGDVLHPGPTTRSGTVYVANIRSATVQIVCNPQPTRVAPLEVSPAPGSTTSCTFSVKDPSPSPVVPSGTVSWTLTPVGGAMGAFVPQAPGPCALQPVDAATAQCPSAVTYTATNRGTPDGTGPGQNTHVITVAYSNDTWHSSSTGTYNVSVHN